MNNEAYEDKDSNSDKQDRIMTTIHPVEDSLLDVMYKYFI